MTDLFKIGDTEFDFAPETTVTFRDGGIIFHLIGRAVPYDAALPVAAFWRDGWGGSMAPILRSSVFHFYDNHDVAARRLSYPMQAPRARFDDFSLWEQGFLHGTKFVGVVDLRTDRVELNGVLRGVVGTEVRIHEVRIHVVRHFPVDSIELRPYTYCSLEEALAAPVARVRRLYLGNRGDGKSDWNGQWIDELTGLANLEELSLENLFVRTAECPVWPDAFCSLTQLRRLHIRGADFSRLPNCFGDLDRLEELSLTYGRLEELPASLAQLVRLKKLSLDGNRLRTLPDFIGRLPALACVSLNDNPFIALPGSLCAIPQIKIEKKAEALFRDIRYRPDVDVPIDREALMARNSPAHVERLADVLARHGLERYQTALLRHARQALRLRTTSPEDYAVLGNTRIGGVPDLPPDIPYPITDGQYWRFYAQIDLQALAPLQSWLPREGWLYFFAEGGGGMQHTDPARVFYYRGSRDALRPYAYPEDTKFADGDDAHPGFKVEVDATVSVPPLYADEKRLVGEDAILLQINKDHDMFEAYCAVEAELTGDETRRNGAHLMNAYVFTQSESPEEQASLKAGGLPAEWLNLLTLVSADPRPGFCFWDAGDLTFSIHEKDLALADFSRTVWSLESG